MAYNTKSIVKDVNQKPVPQYYNSDTDNYEVLQGKNGASKTILFDSNGNEIDLDNILDTIITILDEQIATFICNIREKMQEKTYYCKSSETKPSAVNKLGAILFEIDTTGNRNHKVYVSDGTQWMVI